MKLRPCLLTATLPILLLACGGEEEADDEDGCAGFPEEATPLDGTLDGRDDCGAFSLAVGDHAYVNVEVGEPEAECTGTASGAVALAYDPIYSNPSNGEPKWTFDLEALSAGEGELDVSCVEGSRWSGRFEVSD